MKISHWVAMFALCLAACDDQATFDARRALPEETQRMAFADCAKEMGFLAGWLHLHKLKSRGGLLHVIGSDGSGVTVGEALRLNRCAWAKLDAINASN